VRPQGSRVEGYVQYIRNLFSREQALFASVTSSELHSEEQHLYRDESEPVELDKDIIFAELSKICNISLNEGDNPALTQETRKNTTLVRERNAAFGVAVKRLYSNRCAICSAGAQGLHGETEVEGAHIYPKSLNGSDNVRNGICLCKRHHWAFDVGWFAFLDDYTVIVHQDIPNEPDYAFIRECANKRINFPQNEELKPHLRFIRERRKIMNFD
jgi:predicted restriction endonuclease